MLRPDNNITRIAKGEKLHEYLPGIYVSGRLFLRQNDRGMTQQGKHRKLTPKEERFCYEYLANGFNATKAALKAGYSKKTAQEIGSQNLSKLIIQMRIQQMKNNLAETAGISALMIASEHSKIAFSESENIPISAKQKSLDSLAVLLGVNAPSKSEVTGKDGKDLIPKIDTSNLTEEERDVLLKIGERALNGK